jgi:hypothetical protein
MACEIGIIRGFYWQNLQSTNYNLQFPAGSDLVLAEVAFQVIISTAKPVFI